MISTGLTFGGRLLSSFPAARKFIHILLEWFLCIHTIHPESAAYKELFVIYCALSRISTRGEPDRMSKSKILNIRIEPELKKKAKKLAEADGRSLSNWVTKLIDSQVREAERREKR